MPDRPLLVCDLDETLIHANSFRVLVVELGRPRTWWALGPAVPLRLAGLVLLRVGRRLDRAGFKRRVHGILRSLSPHRQARLTDQMLELLRQHWHSDVQRAVQLAHDAGFHTLLATAAFEEHARPLAADCAFDAVVATTWAPDPGAWRELNGEAKRDAVREAAVAAGASRPWILLSDHADDEPLADVCDQVFWVDRRAPLRATAANEAAFTLASFAAAIDQAGGSTGRPG